jgi:hypothetical protein
MVSLLVSGSLCRAGDAPNASTNLHTSFVERGVLSPSEVSNAVALAKQCGVQEAVSVRTYYFDPIDEHWTYGIEVKGREVISDRRVSYVTVDVWRHKAEAQKLKALGEFWVAKGEVRTNEFATFVASNRTIRIRLPHTIPLATADQILAAFSAKRVQYPKGQESLRETIEREDFSAPNELEGPGENGTYKATKGGHSGWGVEFTLEGDTVKIVSIWSFTS